MAEERKVPDDGRTPRAYRSPRRAEQARRTRDRVLAAAAAEFAARGYAGATVKAIAAAAGVSVQAVEQRFGTKAALLKGAIDVAIAGDGEPVAVLERPWARAAAEAPDLRGFLAVAAPVLAAAAERSAGLVEAAFEAGRQEARADIVVREGGVREGGVREGGVREGGVREGGVREGGVREGGGREGGGREGEAVGAGPGGPGLAPLVAQLIAQRRGTAAWLVDGIAARAPLSLSREEAVDSVWALLEPALFTRLTRELGWSSARAAEWMLDSAARLLTTPRIMDP
ncbi:hypothetical protein GCM10009836_40000 [Pseudonocardia ailaonensis]|uniref:HTH tetR-type domain-containing protein n=1 Tax=Pseudonocardia ailaonensis TaxID=367279 RepID=A0ABN2N735_9PSEU